MPRVVVLRMSEELLVVVQRFCWTYNKFDFGKVNDNCFLLAFTGPTTNRGILRKQDRPAFLRVWRE